MRAASRNREQAADIPIAPTKLPPVLTSPPLPTHTKKVS